jgi:hypothetical protein
LHGFAFFKGDGLSTEAFKAENNPFWMSVLTELDRQYGLTPSTTSLGVHIRRGDYASAKVRFLTGLYPLPVDYYMRASSHLGMNLDNKYSVFIASDEPFLSARLFADEAGISISVQEPRSPEYDMWRLSHSRNLILSNSTFSCVAAHLAFLRYGTVNIVVPRVWSLRDDQASRLNLRLPGWVAL